MAKVMWKGQAAVRSLGVVKDPQGCTESKAALTQQQQLLSKYQGELAQLEGAITVQLQVMDAQKDAGLPYVDLVSGLKNDRTKKLGQISSTGTSIGILQAAIADACQEVQGGGGGGGPECSDTKPCPTGKECVSGKCLDKCPTGYTRDAAGLCQPPTPTTGGPSEGTSWGVIALAGAALAGLYFALRPPKDLAAPENRLGDNPRAKKTKTYGKYSVLVCTPKGLVAQGSFPSARRAHQVAEQQGVTNYQVRQFNTGKCHAPVFERSAMPITPAPVLAVRENPLPYYSVVTCSSNGFLIRGRFKSPAVAHKVAKQAGLKKGQYEVRSFDVRDCVKPVQGYLDNPGCSDCDSCECEG